MTGITVPVWNDTEWIALTKVVAKGVQLGKTSIDELAAMAAEQGPGDFYRYRLLLRNPEVRATLFMERSVPERRVMWMAISEAISANDLSAETIAALAESYGRFSKIGPDDIARMLSPQVMAGVERLHVGVAQ